MELFKSFDTLIFVDSFDVVNNREQDKVLLDIFPEVNKSICLIGIHLMKLSIKLSNVINELPAFGFAEVVIQIMVGLVAKSILSH